MILKTALFLHVLFAATLFGGVSILVMYLRDATRATHIKPMLYSLKKVQRWNKTMIMPVTMFTLVTGIYMLFQYTQKPLWLLVKERFGSLSLLLFIVFILTYGQKLVLNAESKTELEDIKPLILRYIHILNFFILVMVVLIFVVTFKI